MGHRMQPRVSVIMGIYNCDPTLAESLNSIVRQTYTDWEMILCDDASTDDTLQVAREWARRDPRIKVLANESNLGLARTLNRCIAEARGELLARQDGDDISELDRLEKLVAAIDAYPDIAVVSSWMATFDENGIWGQVRTKPFPIDEDFLTNSPICHAPSIMRKAAVVAVGGYGTEPWLLRCQDYYLWSRLYAAGHRAMNLQEPLYRMRDDQAAQQRRSLTQRLIAVRVRWRAFGLLGLPLYRRFWAIKPILTWIVPNRVYKRHRRARLGSRAGGVGANVVRQDRA